MKKWLLVLVAGWVVLWLLDLIGVLEYALLWSIILTVFWIAISWIVLPLLETCWRLSTLRSELRMSRMLREQHEKKDEG